MSSSEPGERAQCSVAELLARYGEAAPTTGRRRRRAPDDDYTDPHAIIQRIRTDSGPLPALGQPHRRRAAEPDPPSPRPGSSHRRPELAAWDDQGRKDVRDGSWSTLDGHMPGPAAFDDRSWTDRDRGGQAGLTIAGDLNGQLGRSTPGRDSAADDPGGRGRTDMDGVARSDYRTSFDVGEDTWMELPPPVSAVPAPFTDSVLASGPPTEELPRLTPQLWSPDTALLPDPREGSGELPAGLAAGTSSVARRGDADLRDADLRDADLRDADLRDADLWDTGVQNTGVQNTGDPEAAWDDAELSDDDARTVHGPRADGRPAEDYGPAEDDGHPEVAASGSPVREWVVMATQVCVGVVGGAVLWLICEWLWQRIPVVALVVALAVITGLVWVVRRVRRAEDLQTTVIAVLVGLFVTVSPAALLLVGR